MNSKKKTVQHRVDFAKDNPEFSQKVSPGFVDRLTYPLGKSDRSTRK